MKVEEIPRGHLNPPFHNFRPEIFVRARRCDVCKFPIESEGSACRSCKYACHTDCETKVIAVCDPSTVTYKTTSPLFDKSSDKFRRTRSLERHPSLSMDITYVTERIIVVVFPKTETETVYKNNLKDVTQMLRTKHGTNYTVFNLSERRQDLSKLNPQVLEFGWPQNLAPPLERLCSICKSIDSWMSSNSQNIAVIHSKNDKGRAGIVIAAYMHYCNICASADTALDRFAMKQFYDDKLAPYMHPSQRRYVHYFSGLLSGIIRLNNNPLYLQRVIIYGVPNFDAKGGCKPFIKVYQGMQLIYSSGVYSATDKSKKITIGLDPGLQVRGDIFIKCYHKSQRPTGRYPVFRTQFHTCTIDSDHLSFDKSNLDDAVVDSRFPDNGKVEFWFSYTKGNFKGLLQDSMIPVESSNDPLVKWDSYENFDSYLGDNSDLDFIETESHESPSFDSSHLYATVRKEKKYTEVLIPPLLNHDHFVDIDGPHSIDSGISSSSGARNVVDHRHLLESSASKTSPRSCNLRAEQSELDQLVNGMLKEIQSIPDAPLKPSSSLLRHRSPTMRTFSSVTRTLSDSDYATPRTKPTGIVTVNGTKQVFTTDDRKNLSKLDDLSGEDDMFFSQKSTYSYTTKPSTTERQRFYSDGQYPLENLQQRHITYGDSIRFYKDNVDQSWLHQQQEKLRARREGRVWEDRQIKEQKLLAELRSTHHSKMPNGGGNSSDDCSSYTLPLHVNTYNGHSSSVPQTGTLKPPLNRNSSAPSSPILPHRTSSKDITRNRYPQFQTQSKTIVRQKSDTSYDRERPFVTTKRAHQLAKEQIASSQTSPHHVIAHSNIYSTYSPSSSEKRDPGLLRLLSSPTTKSENLTDPALVKLDKLEQSLQALSGPSDLQHSPFSFSQSTPVKTGTTITDGPSWSPSIISSSPPSSPSRLDRPETPAFPVPPGTPYQNQESPSTALPPKSPNLMRKDRSPSPATIQKLQHDLPGSAHPHTANGQSSPTVYFGQSRPSSLVSINEIPEVIHHHPLFVKQTSKYWYKPNISREEAISMLRDRAPGTFVVRDSSSFPGAYGLALKVATMPPNVQNKSGDLANELVRHFLIEPTSKGVRLKGCPNEPIFSSLSALVYQHSITSLALPCKLLLPETDPAVDFIDESTMKNDALLEQGAACSVLYMNSVDMESLTGPQAVRKALTQTLAMKPLPVATPVHFKVSSQGITLTDNTHRLFFRRHYPVKTISHCSIDLDDRKWAQVNDDGVPLGTSRCFGFIARKPTSQMENQCHLFAELDPDQPASAIVNFVTKVMMVESQQNEASMV